MRAVRIYSLDFNIYHSAMVHSFKGGNEAKMLLTTVFYFILFFLYSTEGLRKCNKIK